MFKQENHSRRESLPNRSEQVQQPCRISYCSVFWLAAPYLLCRLFQVSFSMDGLEHNGHLFFSPLGYQGKDISIIMTLSPGVEVNNGFHQSQ